MLLPVNPLLDTDSFKASHDRQLPPDTETVSAYIEARGGRFDRTLFFGLQIYLQSVLAKPITLDQIDEARAFHAAHGQPFRMDGWLHILNAHDGRLPLEIQAVPEGSVVATGNALLQIHNTDPAVPWLTMMMQTALLRAVWYPSTVATQSHAARALLADALAKSADAVPPALIDGALRDLGSRSAASFDAAAIGGAAHLVSFTASDNIPAILAARRYYQEPMAGTSHPAADHAVVTAWGPEREAAAYGALIDGFGGKGRALTVVSDSYDIDRAVARHWGDSLRDKVKASGGTVYVRPDSGDPVQVTLRVLAALGEAYGAAANGKGFRVLPPEIRVMQGDGITLDVMAATLDAVLAAGWSAENLAFGMGSGLLQKLDRDSCGFAMSASAVQIRGIWQDVGKNPSGSPLKASKRGRLALIEEDGAFRTIRLEQCPSGGNRLRPVFRNGQILSKSSFAEIRARARGLGSALAAAA